MKKLNSVEYEILEGILEQIEKGATFAICFGNGGCDCTPEETLLISEILLSYAKTYGVIEIETDIKNKIEKLDTTQIGKLFMSLLDYKENGETPDFENDLALEIAFNFMKDSTD